MRRWTIRIATALSLLLAIAFATLWVRSYFAADDIELHQTFTVLSAYSVNGNLYLTWRHVHWIGINERDIVADTGGGPIYWNSDEPYSELGRLKLLVYFSFEQKEFDMKEFSSLRSTSVSFPHWLPLLLFSILPVIRLCQFLRLRRRRQLGLCLSCGYDLRAGHATCPECGTAATPLPQ